MLLFISDILTVIPIIGFAGFVRQESENIIIGGTSKAQNRAIGVVEIGRHLIDLEAFAVGVSGCMETVVDIFLHADLERDGSDSIPKSSRQDSRISGSFE